MRKKIKLFIDSVSLDDGRVKLLPLTLALTNLSHALNIQIDYSLDTNNFFDTAEKKAAIEAVADFYGDLIQDNLLTIDRSGFGSSATWSAYGSEPSTGSFTEINTNAVIPENTLIVYVGSRNLPGNTRGIAGPGGFSASGTSQWVARVRARGQAGANYSSGSTSITDFASWGGTIAFDADSTWNFSLTKNQAGVEFVKIALHEMGHVLGIGTADSYENLLLDGKFNGAAAIRSNGGVAPSADSSHLTGGSPSPRYGSFGTAHGIEDPVLMLASSFDTGSNFDVATDLDLAVLCDIGWELAPPASLQLFDSKTFVWPSVSFYNYQIQRGGDLISFPNGSSTFDGDGTLQNWIDTAPPADKAFYRLVATPVFNTKSASPSGKMKSANSSEIIFEEHVPRLVGNCSCVLHD